MSFFLIKASVVCSFSVFARKKLYLGDFALVLISYRDSEFWAKIYFLRFFLWSFLAMVTVCGVWFSCRIRAFGNTRSISLRSFAGSTFP